MTTPPGVMVITPEEPYFSRLAAGAARFVSAAVAFLGDWATAVGCSTAGSVLARGGADSSANTLLSAAGAGFALFTGATGFDSAGRAKIVLVADSECLDDDRTEVAAPALAEAVLRDGKARTVVSLGRI